MLYVGARSAKRIARPYSHFDPRKTSETPTAAAKQLGELPTHSAVETALCDDERSLAVEIV